MYFNATFKNADSALKVMSGELLRRPELPSRAGKVRELTHVGLTLSNPLEREILLPGRKASIAAQIAETMWVLAGRDDIEWLSNYLPRVYNFSDDGKTWRAGYGKRLRKWGDVDQLAYVVETLRRDPMSRQAVMTIWDPAIDTQPGKDIACNNWLTFTLRDNWLDLHVGIRSNDLIWGWSGINQFEWSVLQEIVAGLLSAKVGSLHFSITNLHVYGHHWQKAAALSKSALPYAEKNSPRFETGGHDQIGQLDYLFKRWFELEEAIRTGSTNTELAVNEFPEPMLRSWLRVLQWWWSADRSFLEPIAETRLEQATRVSVQQKTPVTPFVAAATKLHDEKHAAYGDSWKRRGEMLGIMANIARKIDRLGGSETADETSADTAMDLLIYLAKYRSWLADPNVSTTDVANEIIARLAGKLHAPGLTSRSQLEDRLTQKFDFLEATVSRAQRGKMDERVVEVENMLGVAFRLAQELWTEQQAAPTAAESSYPPGCSQRLREEGKSYPRTCPVHGLGPCTAPTAEGAGHAARNERRTWNPEQSVDAHRHYFASEMEISADKNVCKEPNCYVTLAESR